MSFFDKKEEVIEIKLTPYGKAALAKGKFSPVYYAFYDDDILYDSEYAAFTEEQNDTEDRILNDTPSLKVQPVMSSREEAIRSFNEKVRAGEISFRDNLIQQTPDREYSLTSPLASSEIGNQYAPAWNINFINCDVSSINAFYTGSHMNVNIPQVEVTNLNVGITLNPPTELGFADDGDESLVGDQDFGNLQQKYNLFDDGSTLAVNNGYILLSISENNVDFQRENFDIEIYAVEEENGVETLHPLKFIPPATFVDKNGILVDNDSVNTFVDQYNNLGVDFAEYFFDIQVDEDIDQDLLESFLGQSKKENIFADLKIETQTAKLTKENIYKRILDEDGPVGECDD